MGAEYDKGLLKDIEDSMKAQADGMFLWASLVIEDLRETPLKEIRDRLKTIPSGIDALYRNLLDQLGQRPNIAKMASKILMWAVNAPRPMKIQELAWACTTERSNQAASSVDAKLIEYFKIDIKNCGPILKIDEAGDVKLVHQSAKEFLLKSNILSWGPATEVPTSRMKHFREMTMICLTYLSFEDFTDDISRALWYSTIPIDMPPLLHFAALHWSRFLLASGLDSSSDDIWQAFQRMSKSAKIFRFLRFVHEDGRYNSWVPPGVVYPGFVYYYAESGIGVVIASFWDFRILSVSQ
ncbi:hypothetical protein FPQ18DRAFT_48604 [Pyronema domesticum]|nr:hypothetical protein FPQ18DRAFT_48604 [Pyronema domesticum]